MQMQRLNIQLPHHLKAKLDALRKQSVTASGFIPNLVEQHFATAKPKGEKPREPFKEAARWKTTQRMKYSFGLILRRDGGAL